MDSSAELAVKPVNPLILQAATVLAGLAVCVIYLGILLTGSARDPILLHSLTVLLIALATYSMVALPMAASLPVALLAGVCALWGWASRQSLLLGVDAAAGVALVGLAAFQQRRRLRALMRLRQKLGDLDEECYMKDQALRLNEQTRESLAKKLDRYQQLQAVAEHLSRCLNLEEICQLAVDRAFELIGKSDACLLFLVDKERQELALFASRKGEGVAAIRTKQGDQFDRYVLRTHRPLMVNDVRRDFRFSGPGTADRPIGSVIACPLLVAQSAEGVLRLDSRQPGVYTQDDLRFLDILLDLVDTAMTNARLFAQTQQLAITDGLTGLYRRQPFFDQLAREIARANRTREPLAVLMLDIDDFKQYNDTFGHTAGDVVLKTIADIIRDVVPPDGMCARYGGEEFSVLLPKAPRARAGEIAERVREMVAARVRAAGEGSGRPVTASLGVAVFPEDAKSELELIRQADQRLYQAKRSGKNCVESS
ncbi:MAG: diguanylate cyclase [Candidatus Omnitrophica bacterium]|nr:diguanylate cyclase [Candidatus Omnitrophota bacterium]